MKVISPLAVYLPRKTMKDKRISLNLNVYMHLNHFAINQARSVYFELMGSQLRSLRFNRVELVFWLFKGSKRKIDRANFLSIIEKFFCDALVHHGVIKDDSDDYVLKTTYATRGIDPKNPRVEIEIIEI